MQTECQVSAWWVGLASPAWAASVSKMASSSRALVRPKGSAPPKLRRKLSKPMQEQAETARKVLQQKAMHFDEADGDGDNGVTYEEFASQMLRSTQSYSPKKLDTWWSLLGVERDGLLRKEDYFDFALAVASQSTGSGIQAIFLGYDADQSGALDAVEFAAALEDTGFGDVTTEIYEAHRAANTQVPYMSILQAVEKRTHLPAMRSLLLALAADSPTMKVDTTGWRFGGSSAAEARHQLAQLLECHSVRLSHLFYQLDDDGSFTLSREELIDAFRGMGFVGDSSAVLEVWDDLDDTDECVHAAAPQGTHSQRLSRIPPIHHRHAPRHCLLTTPRAL